MLTIELATMEIHCRCACFQSLRLKGGGFLLFGTLDSEIGIFIIMSIIKKDATQEISTLNFKL